MFIRWFADTTGSQLSYYALEYMRSAMRVAPVRLASVTGILAGRWQAYGELLLTPMAGQLYNAVCCDPSRWTWIEKVPAATRAVDHTAIKDGVDLAVPGTAETISGRVELYTKSAARNVLFAVSPPRSSTELATAVKYDVIIVPTEAHASGWRKNGVETTIMPAPVSDHGQMRALFLPGATR